MSDKAKKIALEIWQEQLDSGIGDIREVVDPDRLDEWLANRIYPLSLLEEAAKGSVEAIAFIRQEAGLTIFV